jgi:hypothetical protein
VELFQKINDKNLEVVNLVEKTDPDSPQNWSPIALLGALLKILSSIITTCSVGLEGQSGFMSSRGCIDATATLKIAVQSLIDRNQEAYVMFVNLEKAFDSVT